MASSSSAIETALRVLSAIIERTLPQADDIKELRRLAPKSEAMTLDELACHVIETHRGTLRSAAKSTFDGS